LVLDAVGIVILGLVKIGIWVLHVAIRHGLVGVVAHGRLLLVLRLVVGGIVSLVGLVLLLLSGKVLGSQCGVAVGLVGIHFDLL
jgi:hypothetical protein